MSVIIVVLVVPLIAAGVWLFKGLPARRKVLVWVWAAAGVGLGCGLGFLVGDIQRAYRDAGIGRLIHETDARLQTDGCERVGRAFRKAESARAAGASSYSSLGIVVTELRAVNSGE